MIRTIALFLIGFICQVHVAIAAPEGTESAPGNEQLRAYTVLVSASEADRLRRQHYDITPYMEASVRCCASRS